MEHAWLPKDAKLVPALPRGEWVEFADDEAAKTDSERGQGEIRVRAINTPISDLLDVLIRTAIATSGGDARAAFYIANGGTLHHITGMSEAYATYVDGFVNGPQSLACGLAAATGKPIITRDVAEEPLWEPWLWLAKQFDYRACWSFPVESPAGQIVGTFAMYYKEPRDATQYNIDVAAALTRAAGVILA
jgi:two-component system CheB/CheR fusion protein